MIGLPDATSVLKFNKIILNGEGGYFEAINGNEVPSEYHLVIWHGGEWRKESLIIHKDKIEYICTGGY